MKDFGDLLAVLVIACIIWVLTALLATVAIPNAIAENSPRLFPVVVATAVSVAIVAFWIKGRSISKGEQRGQKAAEQTSDYDVVLAYGALFEELDTGRYIYDESILPFSKEHILMASLRVLDDPDSDDLIRAGAALAVELSQFQDGVGRRPLATLQAVMFDKTAPEDRRDSIDELARSIANYEASAIELRSNKEREKLLTLFSKAIS